MSNSKDPIENMAQRAWDHQETEAMKQLGITPQMQRTNSLVLDFGDHRGERLTRIPAGYLRWIINAIGPTSVNYKWVALAKAELDRRGHQLPSVEITAHAVDRASQRLFTIWRETRNEDEGLHAWLVRMTLLALDYGNRSEDGEKINWGGMRFVVDTGGTYPVLKAIMRRGHTDRECVRLTKRDIEAQPKQEEPPTK